MNSQFYRALEQGKSYDVAAEEASAPMREVIRHMLEQKPFIPFQISMTSRSVTEIRNPEWVTLRSTVLEINVPEPGSDEPQWRATLALGHVVSVMPLIADKPAVVQRRETETK